MTLRCVLSTANADKAIEIEAIFAERGDVELLPRPVEVGEVEETGSTLLDNARLKAIALTEATGEIAIADDTGLEVETLDGAPGVYSARYAGENATYQDNCTKLLADLGDTADRRASFTTVAYTTFPDGTEVFAEGEVTGTITTEARGEGGFGYDPLFVPDEGDGRTFAEMSLAEKHAVSHRGRAFRALADRLVEIGALEG
jgi:XTP/dITP diphosphohydrolase